MSETKLPATPSSADTGKPALETYDIPVDAIKVFEPGMKDPTDQLNALVEEYNDKLSQGAAPDNYVGAFDPKSDQFFVQTGNANVTQLESLSSLFSTAPEVRESEICIPCLLGWLAIGYFALKFLNKGK